MYARTSGNKCRTFARLSAASLSHRDDLPVSLRHVAPKWRRASRKSRREGGGASAAATTGASFAAWTRAFSIAMDALSEPLLNGDGEITGTVPMKS
jgi:hypothetical protein